MNRNTVSTAAACLVSLLVVSGCSAAAPVTQTPTQTAEIAPPSAVEPTSTSFPTNTPRPTDGPTPVLTPTPSGPLTPAGPWLIFLASMKRNSIDNYLWIINADGSGLRELVSERVAAFAVRPVTTLKNGVLIAYVTQPAYDSPDLALKLLSLPDGKTQAVATLLNDKPGQPQMDRVNAAYAASHGGLAWSPDGRQLAFVGQIDGPSMDVYIYNLDTRGITRISSGDDQAYELRWSPNGLWVIHEAFQFIGMGGADSTGMWAARSDGSGSVSLTRDLPDFNASSGFVIAYGWQGDSELLLANYRYDQEHDGTVQAVDITSGRARPVLSATFRSLAYSPEHDIWLLGPPYDRNHDSPVPLQLFRAGQLIDLVQNIDLATVWWSQRNDEFLGLANSGNIVVVSVAGQVTMLPIPGGQPFWIPRITESPDGMFWAWYDWDNTSEAGLWIAKSIEYPTQVVMHGTIPYKSGEMAVDIYNVTWSPDSQRLFFVTSQGLWAAEKPDFKPTRLGDGLYGNPWDGWHAIWIP